VDDEKVYPPFCYKNYGIRCHESRSTNRDLPYCWDVDFLEEDGVKEADVEKYYRTIDTDKPLFFYKANGK
jgi:hypothetical protein